LSTTYHFDFAPPTAGTTVPSGYTAVALPAFDATAGYGWDSATGLTIVHRSGPDALHQNFVQGPTDGSSRTFEVNLDPGTYKFTFHLGDQALAHAGVTLSVNGTTLAQNLTTRARQFLDPTWSLDVPDGQASITLQANAGSSFALDALDITPYFNASLVAPSTLAINTPATFRGSASGSTGPYTWFYTFMDGTPQLQTTASSATHSYAVDGDYPVMVNVADQLGHWVTVYKTVSVAGASTFYVSPQGDDNNDGSAAHPWATPLGVTNHTRFGPGDKILFQGGVTFQGSLSFTTNLQGTAASPVTIGSYGTGHAILSVPVGSDGIDIPNTGGILIQGLDLVGPYSASQPPASDGYNPGINLVNTSGKRLDYIHIDDVKVSGFVWAAISIYASPTSQYRDVSVINSTLTNNFGSGLYVFSEFGQHDRIENVYVGQLRVVNNLAIPGAAYPAYPLYLQNVHRGVVERSLVLGNDLTGGGDGGGGIGIEAYDSSHILFQYNESAHNFSTGSYVDTGGFDFDEGTTNSIMQYNYSHDNDGQGFLLCGGNNPNDLNSGNVLRYNISQNDGRRNGSGGIVLTFGIVDHADIYNNTVDISPDATGAHLAAFSIQDDAVPNHVFVRDNLFVASGGVSLVRVTNSGTDFQLQGNDYWSNGAPFVIEWGTQSYAGLSGWRTGTGEEVAYGAAVGSSVNPKLANIGTASTIGNSDTLSSQLSTYRMQPSAPVSKAGLNLATFGVIWDPAGFSRDSFLTRYFSATPVDFFGHTLSNRTTWSMGADQGA
jgi:hypothetical protein